MLSLFKLFVKNFFQVFSNFFQALSFKKLYSVITELVSAALSQALGYLTTQLSLCQGLFSDFSNLFVGPCRRAVWL